jgi:hypothetical protein
MRKSAILLCLLSGAPAWGQAEALIQIDAAKVQHSIPRTIYGTFLEPIGHSTYGGLWAQVLENPSFEDNLWNASRIRQMVSDRPELVQSSGIGLPLPWQPLDSSQGSRYEPRWGDAANSAVPAHPRLIDTQVRTATYDVDQGVRRIPAIHSVPYLDVVSALNDAGTKLTLFCVNRHLIDEIRATVRLAGFKAASARGQQLTAPEL